jgi:hypothetical protein
MALTNAGRDTLIASGLRSTITHLGLATPTGVELSGGSPAYARKAVSWTATGGTGIVDNTAQLDFDVGGTSGTPVTIGRVLLRGASSGGTDYGWFPVGGALPMLVTVDASNDTFTNFGHGLINGSQVFFEPVSGGSLPSGISQGTMYQVNNASTNAFQVLTGLATLNVTASGECYAIQCVPEVFNSQGTYSFATGDVDLYGLLM